MKSSLKEHLHQGTSLTNLGFTMKAKQEPKASSIPQVIAITGVATKLPSIARYIKEKEDIFRKPAKLLLAS